MFGSQLVIAAAGLQYCTKVREIVSLQGWTITKI
jgi:hypothetical protein